MSRVEAELADRVKPLSLAGDRTLPVHERLSGLLPDGLRRGAVVAVQGPGRISLLLALLAGPSAAGSWCAMVGLPELGPLAAAELGVDLGRLALVPEPGPQWATVAAALIDGLDVVVLGAALGVRPLDARRLVSRARQQGTVLVTDGSWPEKVDLLLTCRAQQWDGLEQGWGHLERRWIEVDSSGRGWNSRQRRHRVELGGR
ncbi:MAG TPA: hypothetical protein VE990_01720 [Acidimicrobiales bacterium]|nr:hypothetical protein [Acidimicrobiales bacterium]